MKILLKLKIEDYLAAALIFLFTYASVSKILDFENFKQQLGLSPLIGTINLSFLALGVIILELFICLLLASDQYRIMGFYFSLFILTTFTTYLILLLNNDYIPCSCGGILGDMNWNIHIAFNVSFIIISIVGIYKI